MFEISMEKKPSSILYEVQFGDELLRNICDRSGKPRLSESRGVFSPLRQKDISWLVKAFKFWKSYSEFLVLKAEHQFKDEVKYFAVKCSKRGNDVFSARLDNRLGFLRSDEKFFDPLDFENHKNVKTRLLWVTLTYDSKRCSLDEAWNNIADEFNLWITNLRNRYGRIHYVSFPQAFPDPKGLAYGYPHLHIIMFFEDVEFTVFRHMEKDRSGKLGLVYRIEEKDEIKSQGKWHSFIQDFKALSSMKAVWNYAKKHCYNAGLGDSDEANLNNAIMWLYRKKSFNMSGEFRRRYTEFIRAMHKSKEVFQETLDGGRLNEWKFSLVGVFSVFELCIEGDPPPWIVSLDKEIVDGLIG
jgi:hypothetical protein